MWMYYIKVSYCRTGDLDWDRNVIQPFIQGGSSATGEAMGYIAVPGSNTDLYSGTILSSQTGTAETVDGALLGKLFRK